MSAEARARSLLVGNRSDLAVALLESDLEKHPNHLAERRLAVRAYGSLGDMGKATLHAELLAKRLPEGEPAPWVELGRAFELSHRFDEALDAYDRASRIAPLSYEGPRQGAIRSAHWGEYPEAITRFEEAERRGANDAEFWHAYGFSCVRTGELTRARSAYGRGVAVDPDALENWLGLASVAVLTGDANSALASYSAILKRKPNHSGAASGKAWALAELGRFREASAEAAKARSLGADTTELERRISRRSAPGNESPLVR